MEEVPTILLTRAQILERLLLIDNSQHAQDHIHPVLMAVAGTVMTAKALLTLVHTTVIRAVAYGSSDRSLEAMTTMSRTVPRWMAALVPDATCIKDVALLFEENSPTT